MLAGRLAPCSLLLLLASGFDPLPSPPSDPVVDPVPGAADRVAPDCIFDGGVFDGSNGHLTQCNADGWSSFSAAFTIRLHAGNTDGRPLVFGPQSYEASAGDTDYTWVHLSGGSLVWSRTGNGGAEASYRMLVGEEARYLVTISSDGRLQIYKDGDLLEQHASTTGNFANANRKIWVGMHSFKGVVEDLYVFKEVVDWKSASVPKKQPDCTFAGRLYDGTSSDDMKSACPSTLGGALSVAFTLRLDRCCDTWPAVLEFEINWESHRAVCYFDHPSINPNGGELVWKTKTSGSTPDQALRNVLIDTGATQRILVILSKSGYMQIWVNGQLKGERNGDLTWSSVAGRTLKVGENNLEGIIEDVWLWQEKVNWLSAAITTTTSTLTFTTITLTATTSTATSTTPTETSTTTGTSTSTQTSTMSSSSTSATTSSTSSSVSSTSSVTSTSSTLSTSSSVSSTSTQTSTSSGTMTTTVTGSSSTTPTGTRSTSSTASSTSTLSSTGTTVESTTLSSTSTQSSSSSLSSSSSASSTSLPSSSAPATSSTAVAVTSSADAAVVSSAAAAATTMLGAATTAVPSGSSLSGIGTSPSSEATTTGIGLPASSASATSATAAAVTSSADAAVASSAAAAATTMLGAATTAVPSGSSMSGIGTSPSSEATTTGVGLGASTVAGSSSSGGPISAGATTQDAATTAALSGAGSSLAASTTGLGGSSSRGALTTGTTALSGMAGSPSTPMQETTAASTTGFAEGAGPSSSGLGGSSAGTVTGSGDAASTTASPITGSAAGATVAGSSTQVAAASGTASEPAVLRSGPGTGTHTATSTEGGTSRTATATMPASTSTGTSSGRTSSTTTSTATTSTAANIGAVAQSPVMTKTLAVNRAVGDSVADVFSKSNTTIFTVATEMGVLTTVDLFAAVADTSAVEGRVSFSAGRGSRVSFLAASLNALPQDSLLTVLPVHNSSESAGEDPYAGLGRLASGVIDISVYDAEGNHVPVQLDPPLLFKLPEAHDGGVCVFLDISGPGPAFWSTQGVWRASDADILSAGEQPGGVWCFTTHLSLFAAIFQVVMGCTNVELLSPKAITALVRNEDWYSAESATIVFVTWFLLLLCVILGNLRDCWAHRLGSTFSTGKRVNLCRSFMNWGPHVVKHKYAVILVYMKDIHNCLMTGRAKLKSASLTASVQRFLAVRTGIAVTCVTQHCWDGAGWLDSEASIPYTVLASKLEFFSGYADKVIMEDICARGPLGVLRRFVMTVLALHPLLDAMRIGAGSMTVGKRTTLQVASICGIIATNALIFNFSGGLQSWESDFACPIEPTSHFFVIVASGVSIFVNAVPNSFLTDFGRQVDGRPTWNLLFWLGLLGYMFGAALFIVMALANLSPNDRDKWYATLEWAIIIKLLGMPTAQSIRNMILLELFLREDRRCHPSQRFRVTMGLSHPMELELSPNEKAEAETMARQAISAEELLNFMAILGDTVMPDFDPRSSTSEEVLHSAIEPLSLKPPNLEKYPVQVEVEEAFGLPGGSAGELSCAVLHLGGLHGGSRPCLNLQDSEPQPVRQESGTRRCRWQLAASTRGLEMEHALGFLVRPEAGGPSALAVLPLEEVVEAGGFSGSLRLHDFREENLKLVVMPSEAAAVPLLTTSRNSTSFSQARLNIKVELADGYIEALGRHAFRKLKSQRASDQSEVRDDMTDLQVRLAQLEPPKAFGTTLSTMSAAAFSKARSYQKENCEPPPETMVTHSRKGLFMDLVAAVLMDALGEKADHEKVEKKLVHGDFDGLLDWLRITGSEGRLYWIELFALSPRHGARSDWRESFLDFWPTVLRAMRRNVGEKKAAEILAGRLPRSPGPLRQLLVMDREFSLMHEQGCLAELMLARAMRVRQRLLLHPDHLRGGRLGEELQCLAKELGRVDDNYYAAAYLENRQGVYDAMRSLVVGGVVERREDEEATWKELGLDDVAAVVTAISIDFGDTDGARSRDFQMEDGGMDVEA